MADRRVLLKKKLLLIYGMLLIMQSIQGNLIIRSHYIRPINIHRPKRGEFYTLLQEIRDMDEDMHLKYFRMSKEVFDILLGIVGPRLKRKPNHKIPISAAVKHNAHFGQLRLVRAY